MKVFVTGATGFIGSRVTRDLLKAGHQVLGLTRSDEGAKSLQAMGALVHRGTLENPDTLRAGAEQADGVIHCAFDHDFSNFVANCQKDARVIKAMADALVGSNRPLVITSGVGLGTPAPGELAREDVFDKNNKNPRITSELTGQEALERGVNVSVVRLPQVHDPVKQGLISPLIENAKQKKLVAYLGDGMNRWSAAHVDDAAKVFMLAVERAEKGARYNAVAEEGITMKEIAETIAEGMKLPLKSLNGKEAETYFGWLTLFAGHDMSASSEKTRRVLNWNPTGPSLISDLKEMDYSKI